jgi:hypothetical protein
VQEVNITAADVDTQVLSIAPLYLLVKHIFLSRGQFWSKNKIPESCTKRQQLQYDDEGYDRYFPSPNDYLTGSMSKMEANEGISFSFLII